MGLFASGPAASGARPAPGRRRRRHVAAHQYTPRIMSAVKFYAAIFVFCVSVVAVQFTANRYSTLLTRRLSVGTRRPDPRSTRLLEQMLPKAGSILYFRFWCEIRGTRFLNK